MDKLNTITKFFIKDAADNNYSAHEIEVSIRLQYPSHISDLIIANINFMIGA